MWAGVAFVSRFDEGPGPIFSSLISTRPDRAAALCTVPELNCKAMPSMARRPHGLFHHLSALAACCEL
jgi:hypothetical protein